MDEHVTSDRFEIVEPSEYDAIEDQLSVSMYRIMDTRDEQRVVCAYTKTYADACFTARMMNAGDVFKEGVSLAFLKLKNDGE